MRYYEVYLPGRAEPRITTRVRGLRDLPEGTRVVAIVTEYDGTLADSWEIPVSNGKPIIRGRGKGAPSYHNLR